MKTITVNTKKPYDIYLDRGILDDIANLIENKFPSPRKVCVITDSKVADIYGDRVMEILKNKQFDPFRISFPAGEHSKNLNTYANIMEALAEEGLSRSDLILGLGGGTVLDISGFVAGTYMRGLEYISIPTTLLGIIDASVGGKTGVNLNNGKNLTGMFNQPAMVISDPDLLDTLPENILNDGIVEAVKAAVISDSGMIAQIMDRNLDYVIERSISIKKTLVEVDESDTGLRQLLNFGHTLGHGIEKLAAYKISHGAAVAKGMVGEARASHKMGYCSMDISPELTKILESFGFDVSMDYDTKALYQKALVDKKIRDGSINIIVPEVIGKCTAKRISLIELERFIDAAQ